MSLASVIPNNDTQSSSENFSTYNTFFASSTLTLTQISVLLFQKHNLHIHSRLRVVKCPNSIDLVVSFHKIFSRLADLFSWPIMVELPAEPCRCLHILLSSQAWQDCCTTHHLIIIRYFKLNVCENDVCGHVKSACFCVLRNVYVCLHHVLNIFLSFLENVP